MKAICIVFSILFVSNASVVFAQKKSEKKAIVLAEDFIRCNGYTEMPIDTSQQKLSFTLHDNNSITLRRYTVDSFIKYRHNTLYPKANYIYYDEKQKRWMVGFIYTSIPLDKFDTLNRESPLYGMTVIVSEESNDLRISHLNPILKYFKKLQ